MIVNWTPNKLEKFEVFKMVLPNNGSLKVLLKLKASFYRFFPAMFMVLGMSYFALCVQNVVFLVLGPLGVFFDVSSGPPSPS